VLRALPSPQALPRKARPRRGPAAAARRAVLAFAPALLAACSTATAPCTGSDALESALGALGGRGWESLNEAEVVPSWPAALTRETEAAAFTGDGAALPLRVWVRAEREDRHGCVCCQALEFGSGGGEPLALKVVSLRLAAPSWAEASRIAARLLLAGLPPHVPVRLSIPAEAPPPHGLPWETSAPWASDADPDGRVVAGSAFLQIDRGAGGWLVFVRHERPGR
jgi:hypothetical protein